MEWLEEAPDPGSGDAVTLEAPAETKRDVPPGAGAMWNAGRRSPEVEKDRGNGSGGLRFMTGKTQSAIDG